MSDGGISRSTKALLDAARADAPSAGARTRVWSDVSKAIAGAPTGPASGGRSPSDAGVGTGSVAAGGGTGALKGWAIGMIFGGAVTVGLATTLLHVGAAPLAAPASVQAHRALAPAGTAVAGVAPVAPIAPAAGVPAIPSGATLGGGSLGTSFAPIPSAGAIAVDAPQATAESANVSPPLVAALPGVTGKNVGVAEARPEIPLSRAAPRSPSRSHALPDESDPLSREAAFISEARASLVRGDALGALRKTRAARALPTRQLEPEELAVEAQALRALGREGEATAIEATLRSRYPESALAR